jgi:hypothetical protein
MEILAIEYKRAFESVDSERNTRRSNCAKWCVYIYTYIYIYIYIYLFIFLSKSMETRHETGTYTSSVWFPRKRGKEEKSYNKNFTRITTTNLNSQISLQLSATNLSADKFKFLRKFH